MSRRDWLRAAAASSAAGACLGAAPALRTAPSAGREIPLFNGRDLSGWQTAANAIWTVEDGAIVGRSDPERDGPGYLLTVKEYSDFRLSLEFWISKGGNSGVYVREPTRIWGPKGDERPAHGDPRGYEVQIDYNDPKNFTGALYNISPAKQLRGGEDRWNRMVMECLGARCRVWVEGELVTEFEPLLSARGVIGLQKHGGRRHTHVVRFRDIRLAEL